MDQYTGLWNSIDEIAERILSLRHFASGSYKEYTKLSSIQEEDSVPKAKDMIRIRNLVAGHEQTIKTAKDILEHVDAGNDEVTLDLVTQRLTVH